MTLIFRGMIGCLLPIAIFAGCGESDPIEVHKVAKSQSDLDRFDQPPSLTGGPSGPVAPLEKSRMVVGMAMQPTATWTFKIRGPEEDVAALKESWEEFFSTLKFSAVGEPQFDLPDGWVDDGTRKGMFSTIHTLSLNKKTPPTRMEISSLTAGQKLPDNVNRWRRQLGLDPLSGEVKLPKVKHDGGELYLFDEVGFFSGGRPPFAGGAGGAMGVPPAVRPSASSPPSTQREVKFSAPAGWEAGKTASIIKVRLRKTSDDGTAEISVAKLGIENEWGLNVMTWAGQVGLREMSDSEIEKRTEVLKVADADAQRVRLVEAADEFDRAVIGIMFKKNGSAWFVKLSGDKRAVESAEQEFGQFVESLTVGD